ncbi:3-carboxy-cis,cis-mucoante lactonizing enzyme [Glarea lozoyensis ATCC 20868]|uniref:3-carboxy-cis,cis-mucoante lactonizing enzyme n=1 Tax=Glarea lozoyensis (strain ATCC 20868 / MF5171) TaxID=1116229 RepID=S3CP77_GLAL2|nr:3-carboxy-cis,cis-mucoante lactonizing enzyme [Glarea lozoyensis ATCC 20868]EPE28267.1 3-carboxy-cis,cis-mucoante lactonizing enzyme [Glarea lozoyensis ATCC 20868]
MALKAFLILTALTALTTAKVHHLFVGNLGLPASIHALEFDSKILTLTKTATIPADGSHPWISLSHNKKTLYASQFSKPAIASYKITSPTSLSLSASLNSSGACFNSTSAYVQSLSHPPYTVFTGAWPGPNACGQAISTLPDGSLKAVQQSWKYANNSGIHGLAFGKGEGVLYAADLNGDSVWTHRIDASEEERKGEGEIRVEEVGRWMVNRNGTHPRHLVAHPNGRTVHVVMESGNEVVEIENDERGIPRKEVGFWKTIPANATNANYWSAEIKYSRNMRYVWATARAQISQPNITGWINVFELDRSGHITHLVARESTTTTGGYANAIAPMDVDDENGWDKRLDETGSEMGENAWGGKGEVEFAALTDVPKRYVEVWRWDPKGKREGNGKLEGKLEVVAHLGIDDGGCCANVVWLD